jgi:hypothetical protein
MSFDVPQGFKHFHSTRMGTHWFIRASEFPGGEPDYLMVQDTEASLDRNVAMANHNDGWSVDGNGKTDKLLRRCATVPFVVMEKWKQELGVDYRSTDPDQQVAVNRLLDSSDWQKLRTASYRIGKQSQWV